MPEPPRVKVELLEQGIGQTNLQTNNEWAEHLDLEKHPKSDDDVSGVNIETLSDCSIEMPPEGNKTERPLMGVEAPIKPAAPPVVDSGPTEVSYSLTQQ